MKQKRSTLRRVALFLVAAALAFAGAGCGGGSGNDSADVGDSSGGDGGASAQKQVIRLTIGAGHPETSMPYVRAANEFFVPETARRVEEATDYTIEWITAYSGSVAKLAEVLGAVESGLLDVGLISVPFEPANLYMQNINYYTPFNAPDANIVIPAVSRLYEEFDCLRQTFEDRNQKFLGIGAVGDYQLISQSPIETYADLKGVKICAAGPNLSLLEGTGAVPIQGDLTEAYSSLDAGMYSAWIMFPASSYGFKLHEVAPYQTNFDFGAVATSVMTVNSDVWNGLPPEVQDILLETAKENEIYNAELAMRLDREAVEAMTNEGLTVMDFPAAEKKTYAEALPNIPMRWVEEVEAMGNPGLEIMTRYFELLEAAGYTAPRDWASR